MSFNTPTARSGFLDDDDPLFSSAIMDTTTGAIGTGNRTPRRLISLDPPSSRQSMQTPSNLPNPFRSSYRSNPATPGFSASGRRSTAATPHARAAFRTIDQRRAAALTPGGKKRRESVRPRRESPFDVLRGLGRVLQHKTAPIPSSSSPDVAPSARLPIRTAPDRSQLYDDDDDELPIDRPRLSLPLDIDEDDDLVPPRLSEMNEDNPTIEIPRRQYQDYQSRMSMGSVREYPNYGEDDDDDDGNEGFDPMYEGAFDDQEPVGEETLERIENDVARRETLVSARESDFGFQVPVDADQTTFIMAVEGQSSPSRPLREVTDAQPSLSIDPLPAPDDAPRFGEDMGFDDLGPAYDLRSSSPEDYTGPADATDLAQQDEGATEEERVDFSAHFDQKSRKTSKRGLKLSRHGVEYPSLPPAVMKRLAGTLARSSGITQSKITPEVLVEIQRASDWFFEQLGDDLSMYAKHAKRKTIDESDMLLLMQRQRQTNSTTTPFSLAQRHLPRELVQELRMPKPAEPKKKRRPASGGGGEI